MSVGPDDPEWDEVAQFYEDFKRQFGHPPAVFHIWAWREAKRWKLSNPPPELEGTFAV